MSSYKRIGKILAFYKSGKLPRAVRCLADISTSNWENVSFNGLKFHLFIIFIFSFVYKFLQLTSPQKWTSNAVYEVTRIFAANMSLDRIEMLVFICNP